MCFGHFQLGLLTTFTCRKLNLIPMLKANNQLAIKNMLEMNNKKRSKKHIKVINFQFAHKVYLSF